MGGIFDGIGWFFLGVFVMEGGKDGFGFGFGLRGWDEYRGFKGFVEDGMRNS